MRFLRTAPTSRLLAVLAGAFVVIVAGAAIAVAASGSGPVPQRVPLARAVHQALGASAPKGITADVGFTNNLIDSSDFTGDAKDPILQGASGRLWLTQGHLRLELQSDNGDAQILVNGRSFWISAPNQRTVYQGTLPAEKADAKSHHGESVPSVAEIQRRLTTLMQRINVSGAHPTDLAGRAAYRVVVSPKHDGGLLGSAQVAWDALNGTPLQIGIYARGNSTPVLDLKATNISYGPVAASVFAISPPAGDRVVQISGTHPERRGHGRLRERKAVAGARAVAANVPFALTAPRSLVGLPRHDVRLLTLDGKRAALVTYGQGVGGMALIEHAPGAKATSGHAGDGRLSLPTVSINGATGQELSTPLGTVLSFTTGKVSYTVIGSVPAAAAEQAARALTAP